jgi:hypothetical protein
MNFLNQMSNCFLLRKELRSAFKRVEPDSDRVLYVILRSLVCYCYECTLPK